VIKSVGPGRHFLSQKHTRRTIQDTWMPELTHPAPTMDSQPPPDIHEQARSNLIKILNEHQPEPLPENIQFELRKIIESAEGQDEA